MIIEPGLTRHPKFLEFQAKIGLSALHVLINVWGHCQQSRKGEFWEGSSPEYVEIVATGKSQKGKLFEVMKLCRLVKVEDRGIRILNWDEHNASLVSRWGRAQGSAQKAATTTLRTCTDSCAEASAEAAQNTIDRGIDRKDRVEGLRCAGMVPKWETVLAYFQTNGSGYEELEIRNAYLGFQATADPGGWWVMGRTMVHDWRPAMESRLLGQRKNKNFAPTPPPEEAAPGAMAVDFAGMKVGVV